jgi:hypothetical protein
MGRLPNVTTAKTRGKEEPYMDLGARRRIVRSLLGTALALSLLLVTADASRAAVKRSLRTVAVPSFKIGTLGNGWKAGKPVVVSLHAGPWVVGVEVRPTRAGSFRVAARGVDLCGGVWFQAVDTAGHSKIARGPALACPSPQQPSKPTLKVIGGKQVRSTQYRILTPMPPTSVTMHVGDQLYLWEPGSTVPAFTPGVDRDYLALLASGKTPPQTCAAVNCAEGFEWTWIALRAGDTILDLSPACRLSTPPCGRPDLGIGIHIDP